MHGPTQVFLKQPLRDAEKVELTFDSSGFRRQGRSCLGWHAEDLSCMRPTWFSASAFGHIPHLKSQISNYPNARPSFHGGCRPDRQPGTGRPLATNKSEVSWALVASQSVLLNKLERKR